MPDPGAALTDAERDFLARLYASAMCRACHPDAAELDPLAEIRPAT